MYYKGTDSDNIKIIASMSASSVKGYDYKVVAKGTSNTNYEYLREAHTTIARMEIATIASGCAIGSTGGSPDYIAQKCYKVVA